MKTLIVLFGFISFTNAQAGQIFSTKENFNLLSYGGRTIRYVVEKKWDLEVKAVYGKTAEIVINDKLEKIPVQAISSSREVDVFVGVLRKDEIVYGGACDEEEYVSYMVRIIVKKTDYRAPEYKASKVTAEQYYTYDNCHDIYWEPDHTITYK